MLEIIDASAIYWYFDSKAKTRSFDIGICLVLVSWRKYTLKSILGGRRGCLIPAPLYYCKYNYIKHLKTLKNSIYIS